MVVPVVVSHVVSSREELGKTILGIGTAEVSNLAWVNITQGRDPVPGIEHEHWGLVSLIAARKVRGFAGFGVGFGATLILQKLTGPDPLNTKDTEATRKLAFGLDALLGGLAIIAWSRR